MWSHLRLAVIRSCVTLWRRVTGLVGFAAPAEAGYEAGSATDVRARFWAGVREGQREAELNRTRKEGQ
jgi:hypothetical protein